MATEVLLAVIFLFLFFAQCVMKITLKNFDNTFQVKNFFFLNQTLIVPHSKKKNNNNKNHTRLVSVSFSG